MIRVHVDQALSLRNAMVLKVAIFHSLLDVRFWPMAAPRDRRYRPKAATICLRDTSRW